jgi:hypothetical protein
MGDAQFLEQTRQLDTPELEALLNAIEAALGQAFADF